MSFSQNRASSAVNGCGMNGRKCAVAWFVRAVVMRGISSSRQVRSRSRGVSRTGCTNHGWRGVRGSFGPIQAVHASTRRPPSSASSGIVSPKWKPVAHATRREGQLPTRAHQWMT
jgi:hypothetical protein